jgi:uncharacterized membrane protein YkoI
MRSKYAILAVAIAVAAGCATHGVAREVNGVKIVEDKAGLWALATLAPDSAMKIALARVPGGTISKGELEEEDGRLIYSFDIKVAGKSGEDEVHIDARTGEVVKQEHES